MSFFDAIKSAGRGWTGILARTDSWPEHFDLSVQGTNRALWTYFGAALFAIILMSARFGLPTPTIMAVEIVGQSLPVIALLIVTQITRAMSSTPAPFGGFFVPGLYLLALVKLIEAITIFIGVPLLGAILGLTGFLFYKLARGNGLNMAYSVGFALIGFLLLAGLPLALYMLLNSLAAPA